MQELKSRNKIEAFAKHILEECEKEGFTISETRQIPSTLKFAIDEQVTRIIENTKISVQ